MVNIYKVIEKEVTQLLKCLHEKKTESEHCTKCPYHTLCKKLLEGAEYYLRPVVNAVCGYPQLDVYDEEHGLLFSVVLGEDVVSFELIEANDILLRPYKFSLKGIYYERWIREEDGTMRKLPQDLLVTPTGEQFLV